MTPEGKGFVSRKQAGFMFHEHPAIARRWAHETPDMKNLPERAKMRKEVAKKKRKRSK